MFPALFCANLSPHPPLGFPKCPSVSVHASSPCTVGPSIPRFPWAGYISALPIHYYQWFSLLLLLIFAIFLNLFVCGFISGISTTVESPKLENDEPDEDGQRRSKRPRRFQGKESLDQPGIFQVHPLTVNLHIYDDEVSDLESAKLVTLNFEYMMQLNIICVGIKASNVGPENDILSNLFPDDTGLELPHQVRASCLLVDASLICLSATFVYSIPVAFICHLFLFGLRCSQLSSMLGML